MINQIYQDIKGFWYAKLYKIALKTWKQYYIALSLYSFLKNMLRTFTKAFVKILMAIFESYQPPWLRLIIQRLFYYNKTNNDYQ